MYENGRGVPRDYAEAVKWYRKSAAQGNAWGRANLGYMYENGRGVSQDHAEAAKWYRRSAEQWFSSRQFDHRRRDGNGADNIAREQEVASEWRCAAVTHGASEHINWCARMEDHGGPAKPQGKLAGSFLGGFGLQKASSKASFKTWGAPKSKRDEAMWKCRQMAMTGVADAQYHLGGLLSTDRGKARDPDEAHMWLTLAAANGHACAANQKDILGEKLSSVQIKKARHGPRAACNRIIRIATPRRNCGGKRSSTGEMAAARRCLSGDLAWFKYPASTPARRSIDRPRAQCI